MDSIAGIACDHNSCFYDVYYPESKSKGGSEISNGGMIKISHPKNRGHQKHARFLGYF